MAQRLEKDGSKTGRSPSPLADGCSSSNTAAKRCSPDGKPAIGRASGRTSPELNPAIWRQAVELLFCSQRSTTVVPQALTDSNLLACERKDGLFSLRLPAAL